jgi:hypothetical protein
MKTRDACHMAQGSYGATLDLTMDHRFELRWKILGVCFGTAIYATVMGTFISLMGHMPMLRSVGGVFVVTLSVFAFRAVHKCLTQSRK